MKKRIKFINWPKYVIGAILLAACVAIIWAIATSVFIENIIIFCVCLMWVVGAYTWWLHMHNHKFRRKIQTDALTKLSRMMDKNPIDQKQILDSMKEGNAKWLIENYIEIEE